MSKNKKITCILCASADNLYITLGNGERLPSYVYKIGRGVVCNPCNSKVGA